MAWWAKQLIFDLIGNCVTNSSGEIHIPGVIHLKHPRLPRLKGAETKAALGENIGLYDNVHVTKVDDRKQPSEYETWADNKRTTYRKNEQSEWEAVEDGQIIAKVYFITKVAGATPELFVEWKGEELTTHYRDGLFVKGWRLTMNPVEAGKAGQEKLTEGAAFIGSHFLSSDPSKIKITAANAKDIAEAARWFSLGFMATVAERGRVSVDNKGCATPSEWMPKLIGLE